MPLPTRNERQIASLGNTFEEETETTKEAGMPLRAASEVRQPCSLLSASKSDCFVIERTTPL
jgi:hypothetical protein